MLEITGKVNGCTIFHIYGHCEGEYSEEGLIYYYEYFEPQVGVLSGRVSHNRSEGLEKLTNIITKDVVNKMGKKE